MLFDLEQDCTRVQGTSVNQTHVTPSNRGGSILVVPFITQVPTVCRTHLLFQRRRVCKPGCDYEIWWRRLSPISKLEMSTLYDSRSTILPWPLSRSCRVHLQKCQTQNSSSKSHHSAPCTHASANTAICVESLASAPVSEWCPAKKEPQLSRSTNMEPCRSPPWFSGIQNITCLSESKMVERVDQVKKTSNPIATTGPVYGSFYTPVL